MKNMKQTSGKAFSKRSGGFSLIEVLVSVLVLSLGMLGMASLQARAMQFNQSSLHQSQAYILAKDIMDRMRALNDDGGTINQFMHGMNDSAETYTNCFGSTADCSASDLAKYELNTWLADVARLLPDGKASVAVDNTGTNPLYIITLQYSDARADASSAHGQSQSTIGVKQYSFRTEL